MRLAKPLTVLLLSAAGTVAIPARAADAAQPAAAVTKAAPADPAADARKTIATVNGVAINQLTADLLRQQRQNRDIPDDARSAEAVRDSLVVAELMAQEAVRKGIDKDPVVQAVLDLQRKETLGKALLESYADGHPIAEDRLKAEYERLKAKADSMEYHSRHILVDDEKLARDIIAKLGGKKPAKFEVLAKKHSKDSSAAQGGDLGWMAAANLVPEFAAAMVQLKKGEYTRNPVKTQFGWHVIQLDDSRKKEFPEYEKVKGRLANQLIQQEIRKYIAELRSTAKVELPAN